MTLNILRADPAGNITIFVLDEVQPSERAGIASKIMALDELKAEQVGFLTAPRSGDCAVRLEMMGGEFCGNASRALGLYLAQKSGSSGSFRVEVSGCEYPVEVTADLENGTASAAMPLPKNVESFILSGIDCTRVDLDGISHLVTECDHPDRRMIMASDELFAHDDSIAAYGTMFFDKYSMSMIPFVRVKATGSLVREGSCGSGTVAAAASLYLASVDGKRSFSIAQPSGTITAELEKRGGKYSAVTIGGAVMLEQPQKIEI